MGLCGTGKDHCCWLGPAGKCQHVVPSSEPGFNWACALRLREGSWELVALTDEYINEVRPKLDAAGVLEDCWDWPPEGVKCNDCGQVG